jgi:hypothetical protein
MGALVHEGSDPVDIASPSASIGQAETELPIDTPGRQWVVTFFWNGRGSGGGSGRRGWRGRHRPAAATGEPEGKRGKGNEEARQFAKAIEPIHLLEFLTGQSPVRAGLNRVGPRYSPIGAADLVGPGGMLQPLGTPETVGAFRQSV